MTLTAKRLREAVDLIRGAVMICYPMGLPEWDFVRQCLDEKEQLTGSNVSGSGVCLGCMRPRCGVAFSCTCQQRCPEHAAIDNECCTAVVSMVVAVSMQIVPS